MCTKHLVKSLIFSEKLPRGTFQVFSEKPPLPFAQVDQIHGTTVVELKEINKSNVLLTADGIITSDTGVKLGIKTADCLPVVVIGKNGSSILHAGWKGIKNNILLAPKIKIIAPYFFFIGPHICSKHFEVTSEFYNNFPESNFFNKKNDKIYFSLAKEIKSRIINSFPNATVKFADECTFKNQKLHSFRQNNTSLRNWNILST